MAFLGDLLVRLKAETADFQQDMGKAANTADRSFAKIDRAAAKLGVGLSFVALGAMVKGAIDASDRMYKLSQSLGGTTESLSALNYSARLNDVSLDALATSMKKLSVNMADMQLGTGDARYAFQALKLNVEQSNGVLKTSEQMLFEVADKFAGMEDGAGKTALAVKIFGRAGADMIPLLNQGADGLRKNADEARRLGIVLSTDAAKAAEAFNDDLTRLGATLDAITIKMGSGVVGATSKWIAANLEAIKIAGSASEAARLFVFNLDAMTSEKPSEAIRRLTKDLEDFKKASALGKFVQSPTGVIFGGREDDLKKQIAFLKYLQREQALAGTSGMDLSDQVSRRFGSSGKGKAPALFDPAKANAAAKKVLDERKKLLEMHNKGEIDDLVEREKRIRGEMEATNDYRNSLFDEHAQARAMQNQGDIEALIARERAWRDEQAAILGAQDATTQLNDAAIDMGFAFSSAFEDAILQGKNLRDVVQGLGQDILKIALRKAVTEPLGNAVAGAVAKAFGGMFGGVSNTSYGSTSYADAFASGAIPMAAGGDFMVTKPTLFLAGEAGPERATFGGANGIVDGGGGVTNNFYNDMRGASVEAVARLERVVAAVNGSIEQRAIGAALDHRTRNPGAWGI